MFRLIFVGALGKANISHDIIEQSEGNDHALFYKSQQYAAHGTISLST